MKYSPVLAWIMAVSVVHGATNIAETVTMPAGKIQSYYKILQKRPDPGHAFNRFVASWMEYSDYDQLELFLKQDDTKSGKMLLAYFYDATHAPYDAATVYDELVKTYPDEPVLLYYKAKAEVLCGRYEEGVELLQKVLASKPKTTLQYKAMKLAGQLFVQLGDTKQGLEIWKQLLELSHHDPDIADEVLELQLSEGLYEEALHSCSTMLGNTDNNFRGVSLLLRKSSIQDRLGKRTESVKSLTQAFAQTGRSSWLQRDILSRVGERYRNVDDLNGLVEQLSQLLKEHANNIELMRVYSEALSEVGKEKEALEVAKTMVRISPTEREPKEWYVGLLLKLGELDTAIQHLEVFQEQYADDNELRYDLAKLYLTHKQTAKALAMVQAYLQHSQQEIFDYMRVVRLVQQHEMKAEAGALLKALLAQHPENFFAQEVCANHYAENGNMETAMQMYKQLASKKDLDLLLRIANTVHRLEQADFAYSLLADHTDLFKENYRFCSELFVMADSADKVGDALRAADLRLLAAETAKELEVASFSRAHFLKRHLLLGDHLRTMEAKANYSEREMWLYIAMLLSADEEDDAEVIITQALDKSSKSLRLQQCALMVAQRTRNWDQAEQILLLMINQLPTQKSRLIRELVDVLRANDDLESALTWVKTWKEVAPNARVPYLEESKLLNELNRADEAIDLLRKAVAFFEESEALKYSLGRLYEGNQKYEEAIQLYWAMLNAEEDLDKRLHQLGNLIRVYKNQSNMDALITELEVRARTSEKAMFPLLGLSLCYQAVNDQDLRADVLDRILELAPNNISVMREKAQLDEDRGQYQAAYELRKKIADTDKTGTAFKKLITFELLYGNKENALEMVKDARFISDPDAQLVLLEKLFEKGLYDTLKEVADEIVADGPFNDYRLALLYAIALEENGKGERAIETFKQMLSVRYEEVPHASQSLSRMLKQYVDLYPQELQVFFTLGMYTHQAYQYQNQHSGNVYRKGWCPENIEGMKAYVYIHLAAIIKKCSTEEQARLFNELETECKYIKLLTIGENKMRDSEAYMAMLKELYPDDIYLLLFSFMRSPEPLLTQAECEKLLDALAGKYPVAIFGGLLQYLDAYPELDEYILPVTERVLKTGNQEVVSLLLNQIPQMLTKTNGTQTAMLQVFDLLKKEFKADPIKNAAYASVIKKCVALVNKDYEAYVRLVIEAFEEGKGSRNVIHMGSRAQRFFMHFPPFELINTSPQSIQHSNELKILESDRLKEILRKMEGHFLFRLLSLHSLNEDEAVLKELAKQMENSEQKSDDDLLLLAMYYNESDKEKTLRYLMELFNQVKGKSTRLRVGGSLLEVANSIKTYPKDLEKELAIIFRQMKAYRSLEQFTRSRLDQSIRKLPDSKNMAWAQKKMIKSQNSSSGLSGNSLQNAFQQVSDAFKKDDIEKGINVAAAMLRQEAFKYLYVDPKAQNHNNFNIKNCMQVVENYEQADELLSKLKPTSDNAPERVLFEYAFSCDVLRKNKEAGVYYKKIYDKRPEMSGATIRYLANLMITDRSNAAELFFEIKPSLQAACIEYLNRSSESWTLTLEEKMELAVFLVRDIIMQQSNQRGVERPFISGVLSFIQHQIGRVENDQILPNLFSNAELNVLHPQWEKPRVLDDTIEYLNDERLATIQQDRRDLYQELYLYLLDQPDASSSDYEELSRYWNFVGLQKAPNELFSLTEKVLNVNSGGGGYSSYGSRSFAGKKTNPLMLYIVEQYRNDRLSDNPILADNKVYEQILKMVHASSDEEYREPFKKCLQNRGSSQPILPHLLRFSIMEGKAELVHELLIERLKYWCDENQMSGPTELMRNWVCALAEYGTVSELNELIQTYLDLVFSEEELDLIKKAEPLSISRNTNYKLYDKYLRSMNVIWSSTRFPIEIYPLLYDRLYEFQQPFVLEGYNRHEKMAALLLTPAVGLEDVRKIGFLSELDQFRIYPGLGNNKSALYRDWELSWSADQCLKFLEQLNASGKETFGIGLTKLLLEQPASKQRFDKIVNYLADYEKQLNDRPEKEALIFKWLKHQEAGSQASVEKVDLGENHSLKQRYAVWLNVDRVEDSFMKVASEPHNAGHYTSQVVTSIRDSWWSDEEDATAYIDRLIRFANSSQQLSENDLLNEFSRNLGHFSALASYISLVEKLDSDAAEKSYQKIRNVAGKNAYNDLVKNQGYTALEAFQKVCSLIFSFNHEPRIPLVEQLGKAVPEEEQKSASEWLVKQPFPYTHAQNLLEIFLRGKDTNGYLSSYLADEKISAQQRTEIYGWMLANDQLTRLKDSEQLLAMLALQNSDEKLKYPWELFKQFITYVQDLEDEAYQQELAYDLFKIWRQKKVSRNQNDTTAILLLAKTALVIGEPDKAIKYMEQGHNLQRPQTYAFALRNNRDDFVRQHLSIELLSMQDAFNNEAYVPTQQLNRLDGIIEDVEDVNLRLVMTLFASKLILKDDQGKAVNRSGEIENVLAEIADKVEDVDQLGWVMQTCYKNDSSDVVKKVAAKYIDTFDFEDVLKKANWQTFRILTQYIDTDASDKQVLGIIKILDDCYSPSLMRGNQQQVIRSVFKRGLMSEDAEIRRATMEIALHIERTYHYYGGQVRRKKDVYQRYGIPKEKQTN